MVNLVSLALLAVGLMYGYRKHSIKFLLFTIGAAIALPIFLSALGLGGLPILSLTLNSVVQFSLAGVILGFIWRQIA